MVLTYPRFREDGDEATGIHRRARQRGERRIRLTCGSCPGYLLGASDRDPGLQTTRGVLLQRLEQLGWTEGCNLTVEREPPRPKGKN